MNTCWIHVEGAELKQGDYLLGCSIPLLPDNFGEGEDPDRIDVYEFDVIVVTQSCDLENKRPRLVATCPICSMNDFCHRNPAYAGANGRGKRNDIRKGRAEGLHLIPCPHDPNDNDGALVVDFREIFSLPIGYLERHADVTGPRLRLCSPFLEHFSQSFARFFMRVGLPTQIPPY